MKYLTSYHLHNLKVYACKTAMHILEDVCTTKRYELNNEDGCYSEEREMEVGIK